MAVPSTEGFNMDPQVPDPPSVDRESMLAQRRAVGWQELKLGVVKKSIIRQIWLPDEWLSHDDHEPETSTRHGKETRAHRGGPTATAGLAATSRAAGIQGGGEPVVQVQPCKDRVTAEAKDEEGEHSNSPGVGGKHSDGSTGAGSTSTFDTSSNSSKGSACSKDVPGSKDSSSASRNVINISSCITGDGSSTPGKAISLNASINAEPPKRAPTAEEQATAALSAMLGLGKPKVKVAPAPPPRSSWRPASSSLNPNAAEFRPMSEAYASASTCQPPMEPREPPPAPPEKEPEGIPEEMTCLLGVNLLDEICGGPAPAPGAGLPPARASNDAGPEAAGSKKKTTTI